MMYDMNVLLVWAVGMCTIRTYPGTYIHVVHTYYIQVHHTYMWYIHDIHDMYVVYVTTCTWENMHECVL